MSDSLPGLDLSPTIIQDLVRLQGEELLRLREQLDETLAVNAKLAGELDVFREQVKQLKLITLGEPADSCALDPPEAPAPALPPSADSEAPAAGAESLSNASAPATTNDSLSEASSSTERDESPPRTPTSLPISSLRPICCKGSPYKIFGRLVRRTCGRSTSEHAPLFIGGPDFVFDATRPAEGFVVKPTHAADASGALRENTRWRKFADARRELVACHRGDWYYFGTYATGAAVPLDAAEFHSLSKKVKEDVKKCAAGGGRVPAFYTPRGVRAIKIHLRRVGYSREIESRLFEAAGSAAAPPAPTPYNTPVRGGVVQHGHDKLDNDYEHDADEYLRLRVGHGQEAVIKAFYTGSRPTPLFLSPVQQLLSSSKLLVVGAKFVVDAGAHSSAMLVEPYEWFTSRRGLVDPAPKANVRWHKVLTQTSEVVAGRGGRWFYLGTYKVQSSNLLSAEAFQRLPLLAKEEIYEGTVSNTAKTCLDAPAVGPMYATGQLLAVGIHLHRYGANASVQLALERLAGDD